MINISTILLVDDEENIRMLVKYNLEKAGFTVKEAADGSAALEQVHVAPFPDLVLLDLMLPKIDGLEVARQIKSNNNSASIPIIMLTAKSTEIDKVLGLELGADDYITKPFSPKELVARVKAVLRRCQSVNGSKEILTIGALTIDPIDYRAALNGVLLDLTPKEFELLYLFVLNPNQALSRETLLTKIWGYEYLGDTRTIDVHMRHLRYKLSGEPSVAEAFETVRGIGYRFNSKK